VKYELGEEKDFDGVKMRRIVALVAIAPKGVSVGDVGGWVQSEANLSQVSDEAWVSGEAQVSGEARVSGEAWVFGEARVFGEAQVFGEARVSGEAWVSDEARVFGEARVSDEAQVSDEARVAQTRDLLVIGPIGSRNAHVTFADDYVATGCFCGSFDQFAAAVANEHRDSVHATEYMAALEFARIRFPKKEDAQ